MTANISPAQLLETIEEDSVIRAQTASLLELFIPHLERCRRISETLLDASQARTDAASVLSPESLEALSFFTDSLLAFNSQVVEHLEATNELSALSAPSATDLQAVTSRLQEIQARLEKLIDRIKSHQTAFFPVAEAFERVLDCLEADVERVDVQDVQVFLNVSSMLLEFNDVIADEVLSLQTTVNDFNKAEKAKVENLKAPKKRVPVSL